MVARLAALGALDAEGTVARGQPASLLSVLNCAFTTRVTERRKSCLVQEIVGGGFLRWSTVTKREAGWFSHGCVHHGRFGVAGVQELLPAKEIQG